MFQIVSLGRFILFFGFLCFNGGSKLAITGEEDAIIVALAVVNTVSAGMFAILGIPYLTVCYKKFFCPKRSSNCFMITKVCFQSTSLDLLFNQICV